MKYYFDFLANRLIAIKPTPNSSRVEGSGTVSVGEACPPNSKEQLIAEMHIKSYRRDQTTTVRCHAGHVKGGCRAKIDRSTLTRGK